MLRRRRWRCWRWSLDKTSSWSTPTTLLTPPRWRIARRVAADRVISVVDPDARHAHKTVSRRQDGFKAHLAVEPETGLVTDCQLTKAAGADSHDAVVGMALLTGEYGPVEVLADSAYGTGQALNELDQAGHRPLVKPWPVTPAVPGGFTVEDFTVDETAGTATCPAGVTRPLTPKRAVVFGAACSGCPVRERCTTAKKGRTLKIHVHDALQRAHRRRAADPDWQADYRQYRPMVERSIAWLTARREPTTPLPRHHQEQRLAAPPHRRPQPSPAAEPRPGPPRRSLGHRLTRRQTDTHAVKAPRDPDEPTETAHRPGNPRPSWLIKEFPEQTRRPPASRRPQQRLVQEAPRASSIECSRMPLTSECGPAAP